MTSPKTADEVIAHFGLKPHPEGGWYVQTFRDEEGQGGRAHSTAILYLLKAGEVGRWHRVDAAEVWHWYGGAPLLLEIKDGETRHDYRLGSDWLKGEHPHAAVPAHAWQSARSLGAFSLVGCTSRPASISPASKWPLRAGSRRFAARSWSDLHTSPWWGGRRALARRVGGEGIVGAMLQRSGV